MLGKDVYSNNSVYFMDTGSFGVHIISATTRYGKSVLVKIFETQLAQERPVIIFDFVGEHLLAKYPNFLNTWGMSFGVPGLKTVSDICFKVSDFNNKEDWASMGFPPGASSELANLVKYSDIYGDSFKRFVDFCKDIPTNPSHVNHFEKKYGIEFPPMHEATKGSIITRLKLFDDFFWDFEKELKGEQVYIENWGDYFINNPHLHINLKLYAGGFDIFKGRANCGKILEQLAKSTKKGKFFYLHKMKPVIFVEEADILAPNMKMDDVEPSSLVWLRYYVMKLQRTGVELFFVTQDPQLLDSIIISNYHNKFLGVIESKSDKGKYTDMTKHLRWDIQKNYREFLWEQKGRYRNIVFYPMDSPCALP